MQRFLKVIIPITQVSAVALVLGWEKLSHTETTLLLYVLPLTHVLLNLNFPLVMLWWPIIHSTEWLSGYVPFLGQQGGTPGIIAAGVSAFAVILSIALFWYIVVVEIQMRSQRKSLVRFSSPVIELLKIVFCLVCGLASFVHGYTETLRPFRHGLARYGLWPEELVLSALFLATWGIAFLALSVLDFWDFTSLLQLRKETKSS